MSRNNRVAWIRVLAVAIPAAVLWRLLPAVPFDLPSYALWASILLLPVLLVALIRPVPLLWIATRRSAAILLFLTCTVGAAACFWPPTTQVTSGSWLLDQHLPEYDVRERHTIRIRARSEHVWAALRMTTMNDIPAVRTLSSLRALAFGQIPAGPSSAGRIALLDGMLQESSPFFLIEERSGEELVVGMAGRPWQNYSRKLAGGPAFAAWKELDAVRIAFNFRVEQEGDFSRLITETRVRGTDTAGTRHFGRYWRFVYPGSAIIRDRMLNAIAENARGFADPEYKSI
jgi:hypothetical protein